MSFKDYCKNITSNISVFTESWGWFIDLEQNNYNTNKIELDNKNKFSNNNKTNKFVFYKNKIQIYRDNIKQIIYNINTNTNTKTNTKINTKIISRKSISSKLSDLELQFEIDDEDYEKDIVKNNIYTKLLKGICFITILLLIVC
jgi:hypothetical protein